MCLCAEAVVVAVAVMPLCCMGIVVITFVHWQQIVVVVVDLDTDSVVEDRGGCKLGVAIVVDGSFEVPRWEWLCIGPHCKVGRGLGPNINPFCQHSSSNLQFLG